MDWRKSIKILCVFFCLPFLMPSLIFAAPPLVRLGVDEFPPYISKDLPGYGILGQIVAESFERAGFEAVYVFVPWKRALKSVEEGEFLDGTPAWFRTPEREAAFYVSDALVDDSQSFFHLKDFPFDWEKIEDLKGVQIGATLGYDYGEDFARAYDKEEISVEWVSRDVQNFRKLLVERIQVFPMNTLAGYGILQTDFSEQDAARITHHPRPLRAEALHLLLSKKNPENAAVMERFNRGLKELKKSGRYDEILK
ncbi:polar amino acid transport system substrate-binding protein [Desulfobotulus alkaliphilus]|uniref:Polar amino acid transport system substrate-binding protein n=1 Tax=Desulfobotulus alkaliphilus TaxID=622671 RepID=A0A562R7M9_9BACT|nr:transporter substrate-binding domain-containing protein [Desulfobotulus alkaliphilus]TWI65065.1 polar amino acid transport system substrate-binding protein [Desulfobotulus alkaliphilus]